MSALRAWWALLVRYGAVLRTSWRHRDDDRMLRVGADEAEFMPAALAVQAQPISPTARASALLLSLLLASAVLWSVFGRIDVIVNASGKLMPSSRVKSIASVEIASVRKLFIEDGQRVRQGEVLIELDASARDADRDRALGEGQAALLQAARATALLGSIDGGRAPRLAAPVQGSREDIDKAARYLEGQYQEYASKLRRADADIAKYSAQLPLAQEKERDYQALLATHDVSAHAYLEKKQALIDVEAQLTAARLQRAGIVAETRKATLDSLTEADKAAAVQGLDAAKAASQGRLLRLVSPIAGTVQQLTVHTIGGVVPAAQTLLTIVPDDAPLEVEATIENRDIGFLKEGLPVAVKVEAFQFTKYGTIPAVVSQVPRDAIQDEKRGLIYPIRIALARPWLIVDGKKVMLSSGMAVTCEIRTGDRRLIEYVLSPLVQHARESLHER